MIEASEFANKIAFIKNGEIFLSDKSGVKLKQVTKTSGNVENFLFSPTLKHLAYSRIIKYADEPGIFDEGEEVPKRAICSIVIMELEKQKILKEIMPQGDEWIYTAKWLPGEKLLFYSSSGFDVSGFFEYDVKNGIKSEVDYNRGHTLSEADFNADGSVMVYVDDSGVGTEFKEDLHFKDLISGTDKIILSMKSLQEQKISNNINYIAFIETENQENLWIDNLWIYTIKDNSIRKIYRGPANAKIGGINELSWSFDDSQIGMFFSPEALVLNIINPDNIHKIRGKDFNWIENNLLFFSKGTDIYQYNLETKKTKLFLKNISKITFLSKTN